MPRTGVANLPLHPGKAPRWLFDKMVLLSKGITEVIVHEYGKDEFLRRISDPFWFQALSCVLGYDWHSSGTTTVTCGALKEALDPEEHGFAIAGGKGKASRKTLQHIEKIADSYSLSSNSIENLKYASRMAAKIDNTAVQDGHALYHHVIIFTEDGNWAVIQQGMNNETGYARRYHWLSEKVESFVCEPHNAIVGEIRMQKMLDMTARQSKSAQKISVDLVNDNPMHLKRDWAILTKSASQRTLDDWIDATQNSHRIEYLHMPRAINWRKMNEIYDIQPKDYEQLLAIKGVGPSTVRALALISDLIYGEKPSWNESIRFTYAHGGKDGVPYPVDLATYSKSIEVMEDALKQAKIGDKDKLHAIKRLHNYFRPIQ